MKNSAANLLALVTGLFISSAVQAEDTIALSSAFTPSVTLIGSGCALDSGANSHWEGSTLVLNFGSMVAEKGAGISLAQSRKNCSITLDLNMPDGLSYALVGYRAEGFDDLTGNDTRTFTLSNFFQGQGTTASVKNVATGPRSSTFNVRHSNNASETVWSPCNVQRAHTITAAVWVGGGTELDQNSAVALDSLRLGFRIRPCSSN